jgi:RHS repeat-associated protein
MRLVGQINDAATGYAHHRFRVFDPQTRRFLTQDPIGLLGGLNPYNYPTDPVTFGDPLGLAKCTTPAAGEDGALPKTYQTYTKTNPETGEVYTGRTSGTGTPEQNVARRDANHHMSEDGFGPAVLDQSSASKDAIRGREQQLIDANGGAQSNGGTSGNAINGISPKNKNRQRYLDAAEAEFGS